LSHRHEQIESTIKRAVQQVLARGLQDPRADGGMITVTSLSVSQDLKVATVRVSVYPEAKQKLVMHAVKHAAAHLRHQVAEVIAMKQVPQFIFEYDGSLKKHVEVLDALRKVTEELRDRPQTAEADDADAEDSTEDPRAGNNAPEARTP